MLMPFRIMSIIPYQELPGNYNLLKCANLHVIQLYHTKNYQGTTTYPLCGMPSHSLYHTKNYQGTTTFGCAIRTGVSIIPYQELPGNYNRDTEHWQSV